MAREILFNRLKRRVGMPDLYVQPIPLFKTHGRYEKPKMTYLFNFGQDMVLTNYVWFIAGGARRFLVDAGATAEMSMALGRSPEEVTRIQTLEEGLARLSLKPGDIDTVILTQLHWDHVGLAHEFVNAEFVVQKVELEMARDPHAAVRFYDQSLFEGLPFDVRDGDSAVADGIDVLLTPGHTAGGQSVSIESRKGTVVLTGFCCIRENFEPPEEIRAVSPLIPPGIHMDLRQAYESMLRVRDAADIIVPLHEPSYANVDRIP
jgi:glyoxylase-like metal-dependent hydrolase (beta-lactamase superfamily II)